MFAIVFTSVLFYIVGILISYFSLRKDDVKQGIYGHLVFYLYLVAIAVIFVGSVGISVSNLWNSIMIISLGWLLIGRVLTFMRLFREMVYLHIAGGIIFSLVIIVLAIVQSM